MLTVVAGTDLRIYYDASNLPPTGEIRRICKKFQIRVFKYQGFKQKILITRILMKTEQLSFLGLCETWLRTKDHSIGNVISRKD